MQHEITRPMPLLSARGDLLEPGYAKRLLWNYSRREVRANALRRKEWDYYYIGNDRFGVALTIADNGYMGLDSVSFLSFGETPWQITKSAMRLFPLGNTELPERSDAGRSLIARKGYRLSFEHTPRGRLLSFRMERFRGAEPIEGRILLSQEPAESMVIATPFDKPRHFYYNQKINCLRAEGAVALGGTEYRFDGADSFGVLDWGRGVWTYHNTWYWSSASGLADGVPFGFNLGCGFGNTAAATENMLFYDGRAHKLSRVDFHLPRRDGAPDFLRPWRFTSDDQRLTLDFFPILDRAACTDFKLLKSDQHQVFGRFSGTAVLDDGTRIPIRDLMGFAEQVENKW